MLSSSGRHLCFLFSNYVSHQTCFDSWAVMWHEAAPPPPPPAIRLMLVNKMSAASRSAELSPDGCRTCGCRVPSERRSRFNNAINLFVPWSLLCASPGGHRQVYGPRGPGVPNQSGKHRVLQAGRRLLHGSGALGDDLTVRRHRRWDEVRHTWSLRLLSHLQVRSRGISLV